MNNWLLLFRRWAVSLLLLCGAAPAAAAVEIAFYSRELGANNFPHAFVTLKGNLDSDGAPIDQSFGFTAKAVTPAILLGSVGGKVIEEHPSYIAKSDRQFTLILSDDQYRTVMATVEKWRTRKQPSYNVNRANCVHFVGEVAQAAGLTVQFPKALMKKPRSFLLSVRDENSGQVTIPAG